jgi:predicted SnoaL-like aldol condensation-catalyzing enzyme
MVNQLVAGDTDQPRDRDEPNCPSTSRGQRGVKCFRTEFLGRQPATETTHEISVHLGQCVVVERKQLMSRITSIIGCGWRSHHTFIVRAGRFRRGRFTSGNRRRSRRYHRRMDLREFVDRYLTEVYVARDAEAARRFIADPCLRHEHGELVVLSLDDNIARITGFLQEFPEIVFTNRLVVADADHVVAVADFDLGNGQVLSAVEAFKVENGKITETWNTKPAPGAWG